MLPRPPWIAIFQKGQDLLKAGAFDEALKTLDEAVELGGEGIDSVAPRLVVLERLRDLEVAFGGREEGGEVDLEEDAPRLFELLARLSPPNIAVVLCHPYHTSADEVQTTLDYARTHLNLIDFLHPEILVEIASYLHDDDNGIVVASRSSFLLASVSRRWRSIFRESEHLWGRVELMEPYGKKLKEKIRMYSELAPIKHLKTGGSAYDLKGWKKVVKLLEGKVSKVERLDFNGTYRRECFFAELMELFPTTDPVLKSLRVNADRIEFRTFLPLPVLSSLTSLTTLRIARLNSPMDLAWMYILPHLPLLQHLAIWTDNCIPLAARLAYTGPRPTLITLPHLQTLTVECGDRRTPRPPILILPALRVLDLILCENLDYHDLLFPPSHPPNVSHLSVLKIQEYPRHDHPIKNTETLLSDLSQLVALTHLEARFCPVVNDSLLDGLTLNAVGGGKGQTGICPLLEKLVIPGAAVTGEALKRMVESRLVEGEGRTRLKELDVSGCVKVEGVSIQKEDKTWLRSNLDLYLDSYLKVEKDLWSYTDRFLYGSDHVD